MKDKIFRLRIIYVPSQLLFKVIKNGLGRSEEQNRRKSKVIKQEVAGGAQFALFVVPDSSRRVVGECEFAMTSMVRARQSRFRTDSGLGFHRRLDLPGGYY